MAQLDTVMNEEEIPTFVTQDIQEKLRYEKDKIEQENNGVEVVNKTAEKEKKIKVTGWYSRNCDRSSKCK